MSTPPVQPPNPNDPTSGRQGSNEPGSNEPGSNEPGRNGTGLPQYGQNAPQYGQNVPPAPQYGQNAPQPGQPQYGQNVPPAPQYGQNAPQPGQPQYGQQPFGQNVPQYGQQPYGQSPYAQYPSEQAQGGPAGVPQSVNRAFWMVIAAGALMLLSTLLSIPTLDDPATRSMFEDQVRSSGQNIAFEDIKGFLIGTIVVFALILAGLYALVAFNIRKGKNWARILGTVLAALSIFSILPLGLNTAAVILGIAAIVMLYMPAASPYFQKQQPFANPYGSGPFGR